MQYYWNYKAHKIFIDGCYNQIKINCSTAISGIKSISFWIKPESVSQNTLLYLKDNFNLDYKKYDEISDVCMFASEHANNSNPVGCRCVSFCVV